ncbi:nitroreductase family deazaflavin-dependent oxidoreductase [Microbacterium sp. gxy059]|uniref:nitroreductase family deazaflavin-dependent oxidoreductase n=1 Tax=Microbacterium sp. gxy059 TaxID=2957199 RepID=UPI003D985052
MKRRTRRFLDVLNRTLNPLTLRIARSGRGPFSLVEHIGRRSGATYEAPLILAPVGEGFVAELTYGPEVNWLRNLEQAGGRVLHRGRWYAVVAVEPCAADHGLAAFPMPARLVLRALRKRDYRLLRTGEGTERD